MPKIKPKTMPKIKPKKKPQKCGWCGHLKNRHTIAGCMGDDGPGASCACDEFVVGTP